METNGPRRHGGHVRTRNGETLPDPEPVPALIRVDRSHPSSQAPSARPVTPTIASMDTRTVLIDAFDRIKEDADRAVRGLDVAALTFRPDPAANSIAWLVWHLTRVQDDHVSEIAGQAQAWVSDGWAERFGMGADPGNTGYGHSADQVAALRVEAEVLLAYHEAVHRRTVTYLNTIDVAELDRIIDVRWDPPVSVGVRLVSVIDDDMQHAGQAAYVRGLFERRG